MTKRHVAIAAIVAVAMIAGAVYATFWLLKQPVPDPVTSEAPVVSEGQVAHTPIQTTVAVANVDENDTEDDEAPTPTGLVQVKLYVLAGSGRFLTTDVQEIPIESSMQRQAKQVVQLLLQRSASFPSGTELRDVFVTSQGVAYVDFSRELVANHPGGSSAEELTVYSLSNTLIANFPSIKMVKILVEGREISTIAGHLDLTIPYGRGPAYLDPDSERTDSRNEAS